MDLFAPVETQRVLAAIRAMAQQVTKEDVASVLQHAAHRKPAKLNATSAGAQARYSGDQSEIVKAALAMEFPETQNMPVAPVNLLALLAWLDSEVYAMPADRWLEDAEGKRIPQDDERHRVWSDMLRRAKVQQKLAECLRRAILPPGTCFGHAVPMPPTEKGGEVRMRIDIYWPHNVEVICHPDAPTTWEYAYVVALRQPSPDPSSGADWFRIYSRVPPDRIDGEWPPWTYVLVSRDGHQAGETADPIPYSGNRLPVFRVQLADPEGSVFTCRDPDLLDVVDSFNKARSNELFVISLQGHDQMYMSGTLEAKVKKGGPDTILQVPPGERMEVLTYNPALAEMREGRKLQLRELAITRANSPDAYATEPGPPLSAASKRISNIAHDAKVAEHGAIMQGIEEEEILPILLDVMRTFNKTAAATLKDVRPRMAPRRPVVVEDLTQQWMRLEAQAKAGVITLARAALEAGLYTSIEDAERAVREIEEAAEPAPEVPAPPPMPGDQPPELADDTKDPPAQPEVP